MLEFLKVMVQPILLERDDLGDIVGEKVGEVQPCYTLEEVVTFTNAVREAIENANAKTNADANANANGVVVPKANIIS